MNDKNKLVTILSVIILLLLILSTGLTYQLIQMNRIPYAKNLNTTIPTPISNQIEPTSQPDKNDPATDDSALIYEDKSDDIPQPGDPVPTSNTKADGPQNQIWLNVRTNNGKLVKEFKYPRESSHSSYDILLGKTVGDIQYFALVHKYSEMNVTYNYELYSYNRKTLYVESLAELELNSVTSNEDVSHYFCFDETNQFYYEITQSDPECTSKEDVKELQVKLNNFMEEYKKYF